GLSGVVYGLFGLLWILGRNDSRFAGVVDGGTVGLFLIWFVFCCFATATGLWNVGNVAHGAGAILGILLALAMLAHGRRRRVFGGVFGALLVLAIGGATILRPHVNFAAEAGQAGPELAYAAYLDLKQGNDEDSAAKFQQALAIDPRQPAWWYNLGV